MVDGRSRVGRGVRNSSSCTSSTSTGASLDGIPVAWVYCSDCQAFTCHAGHEMDDTCERIVVLTRSGEHKLVPLCQAPRCTKLRAECVSAKLAFENDPHSPDSLFFVQTFTRRSRSGPAGAWSVIVAGHMLRMHEHFVQQL